MCVIVSVCDSRGRSRHFPLLEKGMEQSVGHKCEYKALVLLGGLYFMTADEKRAIKNDKNVILKEHA